MEQNYLKNIKPYLNELKEQLPHKTDVEPRYSKQATKTIIFDIYGTLLVSASGDVDKAEFGTWMVKKAMEGGGIKLLEEGDNCYSDIYSEFQLSIGKAHKVARENGYPYPEIDVLEIWDGVLTKAVEHGCISMTQESSIKVFTFIFELYSNSVWPMPGMEALIKALHEKGYNLGIVSNAQFYTPIIMNHFLENDPITEDQIVPFKPELSIFSYREKRGKPDVKLFDNLLLGLKENGINPEEAFFVGNDMLKDIYTAQEAGLKTIFFAGDMRSYRPRFDDERVKGRKPDHVITELKQILEIVE